VTTDLKMRGLCAFSFNRQRGDKHLVFFYHGMEDMELIACRSQSTEHHPRQPSNDN